MHHSSVVSCSRSMNSGLFEKIVPVYGEASIDFVFPAGPNWICVNTPDKKSIKCFAALEFELPKPVFLPHSEGKLFECAINAKFFLPKTFN